MQASACHSFRVRGWLLLNRALVTLCQEPSTVSPGSATGLHTCLPWTQGCPTLKLTAGDWLGSLPMILLLSFGPGKTSLWSCPWPHLKVGHRAPSYLSFSKDFLDSCCTQEKAKHLEPLRISILTAAGCPPFSGSCPSRTSSLCPISRPAQAQALGLFPIQQALSQGSCGRPGVASITG